MLCVREAEDKGTRAHHGCRWLEAKRHGGVPCVPGAERSQGYSAESQVLSPLQALRKHLLETGGNTSFGSTRTLTFPGLSRPARPARCHACDFEMGTTRSDSIPVVDCDTRILTIPVSTTYFTPWMVTEDSAMFVARMTLRVSGGAGAKTRSCCSGGRAA